MAKIKRLVEKYAGKVENNNASAAAAAGVEPTGKVSLPPALELTPRPIGVDDADAHAAVGKKKGGTSLANGNMGGTIALPASLNMNTNDSRTCQSRSCHTACEKYPNVACSVL